MSLPPAQAIHPHDSSEQDDGKHHPGRNHGSTRRSWPERRRPRQQRPGASGSAARTEQACRPRQRVPAPPVRRRHGERPAPPRTAHATGDPGGRDRHHCRRGRGRADRLATRAALADGDNGVFLHRYRGVREGHSALIVCSLMLEHLHPAQGWGRYSLREWPLGNVGSLRLRATAAAVHSPIAANGPSRR